MKILVSACLLGENCKYSGGNNYNQAVCDFARGHQVVPVCPEVLGGLPTPRCPAEIVQGVVTNKEGINVDREFRAGAAKALAIAKENGVELAILQSRSPSCGVKEIYDGTFSGTKIPGQGVFAKMLMDEGIRVLDAGELPKIILKNEDGKCQSNGFAATLTVRCCNTTKRNWKARSLNRYGSCIGAVFCFARHPAGSIPACASSLHRWQTAVCFFVRTAA